MDTNSEVNSYNTNLPQRIYFEFNDLSYLLISEFNYVE